MSILAGVSEDEKSRAFEHWIERCEESPMLDLLVRKKSDERESEMN
jgi:hypothetical protein